MMFDDNYFRQFANISNTVKIYSDFMYICAWGIFAHASTILPLYMAELF